MSTFTSHIFQRGMKNMKMGKVVIAVALAAMLAFAFAAIPDTSGGGVEGSAAVGADTVPTADKVFVITGTHPSYTATEGSTTVGSGKIQEVIDEIELQYVSATVKKLIFGTGETIDLFTNTAGLKSGTYIIEGKVKGGGGNGVLVLDSGASVYVAADGTEINGNTSPAICNLSSGNVNVSGGEIGAGTGKAILNTGAGNVNVSGGEISAGVGNAIENTSTGDVTISGGTVTAVGGCAIVNSSAGNVNVSSGEISGSNNGDGIQNKGTGAVNISGGTVSTTNLGYAIENSSAGNVNISGGTVSGYLAINNVSTGIVTISGGTVSSGNKAIVNYPGGTVNVSNGTVSTTGSYAINGGIVNVSGGTVSATNGIGIMTSFESIVTISGGTVSTVSGTAILNTLSTATITITGGTVSTMSGTAIETIGSVNISETDSAKPTLVTSMNSSAAGGTIVMTSAPTSASVTITGGTVINTATTGAARNVIFPSTVTVNISSVPTFLSKTADISKVADSTYSTLTATFSGLGVVTDMQWYKNDVDKVGTKSMTHYVNNTVASNGAYELHVTYLKNDGSTGVIKSGPINVTITSPDSTYMVTVTGGTASPTSGTTGTPVTLTAGTAPEGKQFKQWKVISGGVTVTGNTFNIGTSNVTIEAEWDDKIYTVTVTGGTASPTSGKMGTAVTLTPSSTEAGKTLRWEITAGTGASVLNNTLTIGSSDVTVTAVWEEQYEFIGSPPSSWIKGSSEGVTLTVDADFAKFVSVSVNGVPITKDTDYTVESGSTVVKLKETYLESLGSGKYKIDVIFNDGKSASKTLDIVPVGGGSNTMIYVIAIIAIIVIAAVCYLVFVKKRSA
jgi:hypothetical protein